MSGNTFAVGMDNFEADVLATNKPVLVDFWAEWCPPCKMIAPIVDQLSIELGDKMNVAKLDADENQEIILEYGVMSLPTLILFKDGQPVERVVGYQPKEAVLARLQKHFN